MKRLILFAVLINFAAFIHSHAQTNFEILNEIDSKISRDSVIDYLEILTGEKDVMLEEETVRILSRKWSHEGNALAARYIYAKLKDYGYDTELRFYDTSKGFKGENVLAISEGAENPDKFIVFSAHYDSMSDPETLAPGADDNGSGVATVLEAARIFKDYRHKNTIIFALFDFEETGPMGSWIYADSLKQAGVTDLRCVNVDMMGYSRPDDDTTFIYHNGSDGCNEIADGILEIREFFQIENDVISSDRFFTRDDYSKKIHYGSSDALSFGYHDFPAVNIMENSKLNKMNDKYHDEGDKIDNMNIPYYMKNLRLAIISVANFAGMESPSAISEVRGNIEKYAIYPNPAIGSRITLKINSAWNSTISIDLCDNFGNELGCIYEGSVIEGSQNIKLNTGNLSSGIYWIRISDQGEMRSLPFVIVE